MSLISFLKNIITQIEALFNVIPTELKKAVSMGVSITENIKHTLDTSATDLLTALIPGNADDTLVATLRTALPQILTELRLTALDADAIDNESITKNGIQTLQSLSGDVKSSFLHSIAVLIAQVAADGKLSWNDGVYLLQWYYNRYGKASA